MRDTTLEAQPLALFLTGMDGKLELQLTRGTRTDAGWMVKAGPVTFTFDAEDCVELCQN